MTLKMQLEGTADKLIKARGTLKYRVFTDESGEVYVRIDETLGPKDKKLKLKTKNIDFRLSGCLPKLINISVSTQKGFPGIDRITGEAASAGGNNEKGFLKAILIDLLKESKEVP